MNFFTNNAGHTLSLMVIFTSEWPQLYHFFSQKLHEILKRNFICVITLAKVTRKKKFRKIGEGGCQNQFFSGDLIWNDTVIKI